MLLFDICGFFFFFFKQKTAYEMRISDWSSDVCSSDLIVLGQIDSPVGQGLLSQPVVHPPLTERQRERQRRDLTDQQDDGAESDHLQRPQNGRASCRERVCQYV